MTEKWILAIPRKAVLLGPVSAVCDLTMKKLCLCPYYKHQNGCPNFGRKIGCPPKTPYFPDIFQNEVFIAIIIFDFKQFLQIKRQKHPNWTDRALKNPRHFQGHLRSELRQFVAKILSNRNNPKDIAIFNPEAMGVNLTKTCKNAGLDLEWPPENIVCEIALIGNKRKIYKILKDDKLIDSLIPGKYAGWKIGKIFGRLDCKSGIKMKKENRVFFLTWEDAINAGYRPCKNCKPTQNDN